MWACVLCFFGLGLGLKLGFLCVRVCVHACMHVCSVFLLFVECFFNGRGECVFYCVRVPIILTVSSFFKAIEER